MNEEDEYNYEAQNVKKDSGLKKLDRFSADMYNKYEFIKENKDKFENLGKNESRHGKNYSKDDEEATNKKGLSSKDGLDDKSGLEGKEGLDKESLDDAKEKIEDASKAKKVADSASKLDNLKDLSGKSSIVKKWKLLKLQVKIALIAIGSILAVFGVVFIVALFINIFDEMFGSISTMFGVSQSDTKDDMSLKDSDGLLQSEEFLINPSTKEVYTRDEMLAMFKSDNNKCTTPTIWSNIRDWFDSWDGNYSSLCSFLRHIKTRQENWESKYPSLHLDRGLTVSNLFYGFAAQAEYYDYDDPRNSPDITNATSRYNTIISMIEGKVVSTEEIDNMIDYQILDTSYTYYEWSTEVETYRVAGIEHKKGVGKCIAKPVEEINYSLDKWKVAMRFGLDAADDYEKTIINNNMWEATSEECNGSISDGDLLQEISAATGCDEVEIDGSQKKAVKDMEKHPKGEPSTFLQFADIESKEVDVFTPAKGPGKDVILDYKNGYFYNHLPVYKESIEASNIDIKFDSVITVKDIETRVQLIEEEKPRINYFLQYEDQDDRFRYYDALGPYVYGAYCGNYLTAPIDSIQVDVRSCDGAHLLTTTFKDYIMGVAYGEVSNSGDNYVLSEMTAAISYALHRRNNYSKGSTIMMRSGNCDQVYCSMTQGCHAQTSSLDCGGFKCTSYLPGSGHHGAASSDLQSKYANLYEQAKDYLIVSNNTIHSVHYVSSMQNQWKAKANSGMSFTQIIQEAYGSEGAQLIKCSEQESESSSSSGSREGSTPSAGYPEQAPNKGKYYGFAYNDAPEGRNITIDPAWKSANLVSINSNCPSGGWSKSYTVNVQAKNEFAKAFSNICKMLTSGIQTAGGYCKYSVSDLRDGGTFVERKTSSGGFSLHGYGLAQDWNYSASYNVNGTVYKPYATQGASSANNYQAFVRALGREEDCRNVNYILYKYAYAPAGFNWGGNWNTSYWDGMHFEVKY